MVLLLAQPFSLFMFLSIYLMLFFMVMTTQSQIVIWVIMELMMMMLMGMVYMTDYFSLGSVMLYFILQSLASMGVIIGVIMPYSMVQSLPMFIFEASIFFKLGLFPFFIWYPIILLNVSYFFIIMTLIFQKLPVLLLHNLFVLDGFLISEVFLFIIFMLCLGSILTSLGSVDSMNLRSIIIWSSLYNSNWLMMATLISKQMVLMYYLVYSFFSVVFLFSWIFENKVVLLISVMGLIGLPPTPLFFMKVYLLGGFVFLGSMGYFLMFIFMLTSVIMLVMYFRPLSVFFTSSWSKSSLVF